MGAALASGFLGPIGQLCLCPELPPTCLPTTLHPACPARPEGQLSDSEKLHFEQRLVAFKLVPRWLNGKQGPAPATAALKKDPRFQTGNILLRPAVPLVGPGGDWDCGGHFLLVSHVWAPGDPVEPGTWVCKCSPPSPCSPPSLG